MKAPVENIQQKIIPILQQYGAKKAALFGSVLRSSVSMPNDIDILVELPPSTSLFDYIGLKLRLEEELGKKVDLVEYSSIKSRLKEHILANQQQIL